MRFVRTKRFQRTLVKLGRHAVPIVDVAADRFSKVWQPASSPDQVPSGFNLTPLHHEAGKYRVSEIYAGRDYRIALFFPDIGEVVYLIHVWKKTGRSNPRDVELAIRLGAAQWEVVAEEESRRQREEERERARRTEQRGDD